MAAEAVAAFRQDGFGYFLEMATRPQTIGYALLESPVALAAWLLDHDTDSYYKISRAFVDNEPVGNLTRDHILDNITLYWLTGTAASAARSYWEDARALAASLASGQPPPAVAVPVGLTRSPARSGRRPGAGSRRSTRTWAYFNEVDKGGHFVAWEDEPSRPSPRRVRHCADRHARAARTLVCAAHGLFTARSVIRRPSPFRGH